MFSVASFLITLRETIEVALIIGIILTYVIKVKQDRLKRDIWIGTVLGIVLSIGFGILFSFVLGSFEDYENIIEGFSMILAAILMTWMIIWMRETGRDYQKNLESKIEVTIKNEHRFGLIALAFISVLREGIETVIFLTGVESVDETPMDILWSGLIVLQTIVWDTSSLLNDKTSELGKFLRTLFGYQDQPTWLEVISYFGYYFLLTILFLLVKILKKNKQNKDKTTMLKTESV
jgi:high-affinity Fe2+/Pb2+ permease